MKIQEAFLKIIEVAENRDKEAVASVWKSLFCKQISSVKAVSMDFWQAFINGAKTHAPQAAIVHDKFHIMKYMNEAVDAVRKQDHRKLMSHNDESLKGHKYLFLKKKSDYSSKNKRDFRELNINQLAVGRAWNRKDLLSNLWNYTYEKSARNFFNKWYFSATHSMLKPVIKVAKMIKKYLDNILTYLKYRISNGFAEGMNSVIQHIKSTARGFRNFHNYRIAILFFCGKLDLYPQ